MINEQIALEREMAVRGVTRYHKITQDAVDNGRGSETTYAQRLIPEYVRVLAEAIEDAKVRKQAGNNVKYLKLLKGADSDAAAFITLKYIFDFLISGGTINTLASSLGRRIEDQIRFTLFEQEHAGYYKRIIEDFKNKGTVNYRHMQRVLVDKANEKGAQWNSWTLAERLHLGVKLIELCIESTGLIQKVTHFVSPKKSEVRVVATQETLDWITAHTEHAELLHPETMPCVVPPRDWVSLTDGGYYTPEICSRVPFVKIKSKAHREAIKDNDFSVHMAGVNKLQQTAWRVNTKVHDVIKEVWKRNLRIGMPASEPIEIPESPVEKNLKKENMTDEQLLMFMQWKRSASKAYTAERERFSKCLQLSRVLNMAEKFRHFNEFYYVYNCDFRGRIYVASPGLSPQGADFSKGLLQFAISKALGNDGAYWLAVQGSNVYGFDKASYDERRAWVEENEAAILAVAEDPLSSEARSFWSNADKPYQFLAFCFEWAGYKKYGEAFKSRMAVALDGTCNGLQNFSAMLRDPVGSQATNLMPGDKPEDIYMKVAGVCVDRLNAILNNPAQPPEVHTCARQWLEFGISRKCAKRPVMTLPYGSTRQSCREYIEDYILDNYEKSPWTTHRDIFDASTFLAGIMWSSISSVVIAARDAMDWLQTMSKEISKENLTLSWTTPTGFKVYQGTMKTESCRIKTQLCGECKLRVTIPTNEVDSRKQVLGIAPNFVHSMDASHLILTVNSAESVTAWAVIHDSYGTYAADSSELHKAIRSAFVDMYTTHDVLQEFKDTSNMLLDVKYTKAVYNDNNIIMDRLESLELPNLPKAGTFDINKVLQSMYFFG